MNYAAKLEAYVALVLLCIAQVVSAETPCPPPSIAMDTLPSVGTACYQSSGLEADFQSRATGIGTLYATNFKDTYEDGVLNPSRQIDDNSDLLAEAFEHPNSTDLSGNEDVELTTAKALSGGQALRIKTLHTDNTSGASWAQYLDGRTKTWYNPYYLQFSIYMPKREHSYRYALSTGAVSAPLKLLNLGRYGNGQLFIRHYSWGGGPSVTINGVRGLAGEAGDEGQQGVKFNPNPFPTGTTYKQQTAVDGDPTSPPLTGSSGNNPGTADDFRRRYGEMQDGENVRRDGTDGSGEKLYGYDYPGYSRYLVDRPFPNGWPDALIGTNAVVWNFDGWTTVEIFVHNKYPANSTVQMWAAPYGERPILIVDSQDTVPLGSAGGGVDPWRWEILNYDTKRVGSKINSNEASRPVINSYYSEVITSEAPIDFPGGFSIPGHL